MMVASARCSITALRISTAVWTRITVTPCGCGKLHRAGNQNHTRATLGRGFGECVAHLAAGAVGDEAHRVERLLRGAGGDQNGFAFEILGGARPSPATISAIRSGSARRPGPVIPQASMPSSGSTIRWPRFLKIVEIFLRRRMRPHVAVHRGGQHHRASEGQVGGGKEIVGMPVGQARQQIGRGGRDHQ